MCHLSSYYWYLLTAICFGTSYVSAMWPESWIVGEACHHASTYGFNDCYVEDIKCLCNNDNFLATVANCIRLYSNVSIDADEAWDHFSSVVCKVHNAKISDIKYQTASRYLTTTPMQAAPKNAWTSGPATEPISIPASTFYPTYRAVWQFLKEKDISSYMGSFLVGWWLVVIFVCSLANFWTYIRIRFYSSDISMGRPGRLAIWWQRNISIPACFGFKHMIKLEFAGMSFMIPLRSDVIVIAVYFILNVVFDVVGYTFLADNPLYPTHWKEMMRYLSDRSGVIGIIQIPLLTLFALRNNVLIWLTGWSYSQFNTYHRAVATITYMQFIVHSVTKHIFSASYGASLVKYFYPLPYYRWGVAAMFLMAIMIGTGAFRARMYEMFLRLHILCGIAAYVCILYHLRGLGYKQTLYTAFGLWAADWIIRLGRIIFLNFALILAPAHGSKRTSYAQVSVLGNDVVNIRIRTTVAWNPRPGQYIFVHTNRVRFWEAHPFSVLGPSSDGESFQLLCKARGGMTKKFCRFLLDKGCDDKHPMERSVLVEGPYGIHSPLERYHDILLVAGGVGITGIFPYVEYMLGLKDISMPNIWFIWAVQSLNDAKWIEDRVERVAKQGHIRMDIYVSSRKKTEVKSTLSLATVIMSSTNTTITGAEADSSVASVVSLGDDDSSKKAEKQGGGLDEKSRGTEELKSPREHAITTERFGEEGKSWHMHVIGGRPNLPAIMRECFSTAKGGACVIGCGPPVMMDSIRQNTCKYLDLNDHGRVDYYEEAYSW